MLASWFLVSWFESFKISKFQNSKKSKCQALSSEFSKDVGRAFPRLDTTPNPQIATNEFKFSKNKWDVFLDC